MVRCSTCNVFHMQQFCCFLYCLEWFDIVEFNRLLCPNNRMYDDEIFADRFRYPLAKFGNGLFIGLSRLLNAHIAYEVDSAKIIAAFDRITYCLYDLYGWIQSPAISKRQELRWCSFAVPFSYPLALFWYRVLIGFSRLLHARFAFEIDTAKTFAEFCRISCCLYDLIRLSSIVGHVQTIRCTMM